jgi:Trk-type K+ transport system membrane component
MSSASTAPFSCQTLQVTTALYDTLDAALLVAIRVVAAYVVFWHAVGFLVLYAALTTRPQNPELTERGFTHVADAAFTTVSAFANAGFVLSSTNCFWLRDNPFAYLWLCVVMLAGVTAAPALLRLCFLVGGPRAGPAGWAAGTAHSSWTNCARMHPPSHQNRLAH